MDPRGWPCLICSCLFWSVHGMVPEPQNVRLHSVMFDTFLQWDPPNFNKGSMTYTVQYKVYVYGNRFTDLCQRTDVTKCNISSIPIHGSYIVRVRTEVEEERSNWVNITFTPFSDTIIEPPAVEAEATTPGVLIVQITDPLVSRDGDKYSIKHFYGHGFVTYKMRIWKKDYDGEQVRYVNITQSSKTLPDLDPGTTYCLQAQAFIVELNKNGDWSNALCITTTDNGINTVQLTIILLSVLALLPFICFMILHVYRWAKYIFLPSYYLPQHFIEFLSKPFYSSQLLASQSQGEEQSFDKIIVLSEESKNDNESEEQMRNAKQLLQGSHEEMLRPKEVSDFTPLVHS
ncbi:interleukin-10 receptor subunit beta isoform X1 [Podarcis lilfordi]|uniref:Interleukin-10 receptor subunit beta isoform X1 n=1 Tax=Podarcis lilfordi TaxID=74358 RepID=A0AA35P567_9SAUR|nr:interleukin-10 receptor subunit beta isoform X1 [Podarcis lilfordi]